MTNRMRMAAIVAACACAPGVASAQTLADLMPQLINQAAVIARPADLLNPINVNPNGVDLSGSFLPGVSLTTVPAVFNAALGFQLGTLPLGPTAGTVIYSRDGRGSEMHHMFGSSYVDRGMPMGKGKIGLTMTFQNQDFEEFDGVPINTNGVNFLFANAGPSPDVSDVLQETLSFKINRKVTSFVFNYGVASRVDLGVVVPITQVAMNVRASTRVLRVRSALDTLASCAGVPTRNAGSGPALRLCQDPHGYDNVLTLATQITYLGVDIQPVTNFSDYGKAGLSRRGIGDVQLRTKAALVAKPSAALAVTVDASLPTGDTDNFLGSGAYRLRPGVAFSGTAGRISPHAQAGYTFSEGEISSKLANTDVDLTVPNELNFAAGLDAAVAPRTTLVADFFGRVVPNVQRFANQPNRFGTGSGVAQDIAAGTDLIAFGRNDLRQVFGSIGGRINLSGSIFANGSVLFSVLSDGLKPKPSAVFSIDYAF